MNAPSRRPHHKVHKPGDETGTTRLVAKKIHAWVAQVKPLLMARLGLPA